MRRVIISVFIMIFSVSFCFISYSYLEKRIFYLEEKLDECYTAIEDTTTEEALQIYADICAYWNNERRLIGVFANGAAFNELEDELKLLGFSLKINDMPRARDTILECKEALLQIKNKEKLSKDAII